MIPDLHDYTIDCFEWRGGQQTINLTFMHADFPTVTIRLIGVGEFRVKDFTESNIVGESYLQKINHADESFWRDLFDGVVPTRQQDNERNKILGKSESNGFAFSITGSYGSLWVTCKDFETSVGLPMI